ncbi:MAG: hypothetical protein LBS69_03890 [Prevotellaceae bacterium]|jgi:hypothetical protein|nr:hypothetical protein [Prevotellaceae bacterium]
MILTDYYKFVHLPDCKSKMRLDCTASTQNYNEFETLRNKHRELFVYFGDVPDNFKADVKRKADKAITHGKNISSVFVPDITLPYAYGDVRDTADCILIIFNADYTTLEIFVARGQKNHCLNLWQMLSGGELDTEISEIKARAVVEKVTDLVTKNGE